MKKSLFLFSVLVLVSCKKETTNVEKPAVEVLTSSELGKTIFEGKGNCIACHQMDQKIIGPSIQNIAKIYKEKNGNMISFLKGEGEPIVDPSQYEVMKTNFAITKTMSEEELKSLESYIYANIK